ARAARLEAGGDHLLLDARTPLGVSMAAGGGALGAGSRTTPCSPPPEARGPPGGGPSPPPAGGAPGGGGPDPPPPPSPGRRTRAPYAGCRTGAAPLVRGEIRQYRGRTYSGVIDCTVTGATARARRARPGPLARRWTGRPAATPSPGGSSRSRAWPGAAPAPRPA